MLYLRIENQGEADIRSFLILGLSSSRDNDEKIGQFGSGAKHAINILLREGLAPSIYSGLEKYHFAFEPRRMGETIYNQVTCNGKDTGWALEFGAIDWTSIDMALREFISNAIDCSGVEDTSIEIVDTIRSKSGTTRIFVPINPEVQKYVAQLNDHFLHFAYGEAVTKSPLFIHKKEPSKARIYRKGVFVRESNSDSLFNYNIIECEIDESRNMDEYNAQRAAALALSKDEEALKVYFENCHNTLWENSFSRWNLFGNSEIWSKAWKAARGDAIAVKDSLGFNMALRKGCQAVILKEGWYEESRIKGIPTESSIMASVESKGYTLVDVPQECRDLFDKLWDLIGELNLHNNQSKPELACFSKPMDNSSEILGVYDRGTVFMNIDYCTNMQTMLEEITHHITQAEDFTRDLQDFAFKIAARVMEMMI